MDAAWDAYSHSRKSPVTRKAGPGFADPDYDISVDWLATREAILAAQRRHDDSGEIPRILLINGSSRSEHTCPGEMSKTWRLIKSAETVFGEMGYAVDILDLSRMTSEFGKQIHPCKSRLDIDGAVPLALQLLPDLFSRPNRQLDERDLPALGRTPRNHDCG